MAERAHRPASRPQPREEAEAVACMVVGSVWPRERTVGSPGLRYTTPRHLGLHREQIRKHTRHTHTLPGEGRHPKEDPALFAKSCSHVPIQNTSGVSPHPAGYGTSGDTIPPAAAPPPHQPAPRRTVTRGWSPWSCGRRREGGRGGRQTRDQARRRGVKEPVTPTAIRGGRAHVSMHTGTQVNFSDPNSSRTRQGGTYPAARDEAGDPAADMAAKEGLPTRRYAPQVHADHHQRLHAHTWRGG
jgi:hypothetical protein